MSEPADNSQTAASPQERIVLRKSLASFDHDMPESLSFLCRIHEARDGGWKWLIFDMESQLALAEKSGVAKTEDAARTDCRKALSEIVRAKAEDISNVADRIRDREQALEWS